MEERRYFPRVAVELGVKMTVDGCEYDRLFIDMGLGGARIAHDIRITAGSILTVQFTLPNALTEPIHITAKARWNAANVLGVTFDGFRAREVWLLNRYFRSLQ